MVSAEALITYDLCHIDRFNITPFVRDWVGHYYLSLLLHIEEYGLYLYFWDLQFKAQRCWDPATPDGTKWKKINV